MMQQVCTNIVPVNELDKQPARQDSSRRKGARQEKERGMLVGDGVVVDC